MVIAYLEELQNEYIEENLDIRKGIENLNIRLKENIAFIKLLEETNDPTYESFTPREVNAKNKKKIQELREEQEKIKESLKHEQESCSLSEKKVQKLKSVIEQAKKQVSSDNRIDDESYRIAMLEMQENDRQRISRKLYDSITQNLTCIVQKIESCSKVVEDDPVCCKLELDIISKMLHETINDTIQMIDNFKSAFNDDIGLNVMIEKTLDKLENTQSKKVNFKVEGEPYSIKSVIGRTLLRIIQEACGNAICYAEASMIQVTLKYEKNKICVKIEDNGKGFDVENIDQKERENNSGFGLIMMKECVYLLSGKIKIESDTDHGTTINIEVPLTTVM